MASPRVVRGSGGESYEPTWVFKHGKRTGAPFDFLIGKIEYLSGPPLHVHREQHDTFYVLEGVLKIQVGDEMLDLMPGDFASVPPGVPHTFDNVRKDQPPVRVCNLMTPGGLDEFFVALGEGGPTGMYDPKLFTEAGEKFGIKMVGPTIAEKLGLTK